MAQAQTPDGVIAEVEAARARIRDDARSALGVTSRADAPPLRETITKSGTGWYTLIALGLLVIVDEFQSYGFLVLGPEISSALGIEKEVLGALQALKILALALATLPMAAYVQRRGKGRGLICFVTAVSWSIMTISTGFVATSWGLAFVMLGDGASTGSVRSVHPSLLVDSYPPDVRMRALSAYQAANYSGLILAPLAVAALTTVFLLTWRGVFMIMGALALVAAIAASRLRDPGFGKFDTSRVRAAVRRGKEREDEEIGSEEVRLRAFEVVRRLFLIPSLRRILTAYAVLGMCLVPLYTYLFFFLDEQWGLGPGGRGLFFAGVAPLSILAVASLAKRGEQLFRQDPAQLIRLASLTLAAAVSLLAVASFMPVFLLMAIAFGSAIALLASLIPMLNTTVLSIVRPGVRPHAAALTQIFLAMVGGFAGLILLSGMERRFGSGAAIATLAFPGIAAALVLRTATKTINADLDRLVDEIVEEEELRSVTMSGTHLPLLACRNVDFSYGRLQVLFGVDFTVDDGEMVALLGTNGAGKSTLLRVVSGLALPNVGSVRLRGADVTYLDPERRFRLGIAQVPSGRAVFPPMSVIDNLRVFGYSLGRDQKAVDRMTDEVFEVFPRLAERREQLASTLSGGEQQMLALARSFVIEPKLLLIDELSLGLAPKVVSELLQVVRRINERGSAVVLVEQSVNVALSLVNHAYFMEKGEIRFDGRASELLERTDLLRSVFLEGATRGIAK